MIDHIDIVKTGAVSVYGSDAIAGVVNIITKKDFQGLQIDGQLARRSIRATRRATSACSAVSAI
jgi:outer membrane receptor for ferrienterochelin and colicin